MVVYASAKVVLVSVFFLNDTATTEIYTLSYTTLFRSGADHQRERHAPRAGDRPHQEAAGRDRAREDGGVEDRKSTRLNSSHVKISYAVFCLKKKKHAHTLRAWPLPGDVILLCSVTAET